MHYYVVDSFTDHVFGGGPAGVVVSEKWLPDAVMQNIAMENNLADTAYLVKNENGYGLRWFMPNGEIDLNGHATLAAAHCLFRYLEPGMREVTFNTKSGDLHVTSEGDLYVLDLPAVYNDPISLTGEMIAALGAKPTESYYGQNLFFVFEHAADVRNLKPDFEKMRNLPLGNGVFVCAPGEEGCDIVGRTFWPKMGVNEDPVCGNMHCNLTPFWCRRLQKKELVSHQLSKRGATVICQDCGDRVKLKGRAVLFLEGKINIPG